MASSGQLPGRSQARRSPPHVADEPGLYLLSTTVARDFGWIGTLETVERLEATLQTMSDLRRVRGHFLNWYDTQDLRPLEPMYVSTVDSGNLAGHLIALAQACRSSCIAHVSAPRFSREPGRSSAASRCACECEHPRRTRMVTATRLREAVERCSAALQDTPTSFPEWARRFRELESGGEPPGHRPQARNRRRGRVRSEILAWAEAVRGSVRAMPATWRLPISGPASPAFHWSPKG